MKGFLCEHNMRPRGDNLGACTVKEAVAENGDAGLWRRDVSHIQATCLAKTRHRPFDGVGHQFFMLIKDSITRLMVSSSRSEDR